MEAFPTTLGCFTVAGYTATMGRHKSYLGGRTNPVNANKITATLKIDTDENADLFYQWWKDNLNFGVDSFTIELPVFGRTRTLGVKIVNDLTDAMKHSNGVRTFKLNLEVDRASGGMPYV